VQIATNKALKIEAPRFNKSKFKGAIDYALTLTKNHAGFYPLIYKAFHEAGVIFVILPNLSGAKINGATKKIGNKVMLMVNDRQLSADSFWFTLFHEIGHILNGDYGISFEMENGEQEALADKYAEDTLIPKDLYQNFIRSKEFDLQSIKDFATQIDRDPGIVLGRLQNDGKVRFDDWTLSSLRHKYRVQTAL
ncbi:MAG: ImmA/IrrE family metallo-endopeptidase, partial [Lachnospiraceae bacterium]|nr:ImmA/IrrE family metallo-endopeptidase [Lachnospiraceae bacterium]